jgi:hypothetical protein
MKDNYIEQMEDFSETMRTASEKSLKTIKAPRKSQKYKSVLLWTQEFAAMRKTTNYLRRKYKGTRNNEERRKIKRHTLNKNQNTQLQ